MMISKLEVLTREMLRAKERASAISTQYGRVGHEQQIALAKEYLIACYEFEHASSQLKQYLDTRKRARYERSPNVASLES
jgi:hypothetical protein